MFAVIKSGGKQYNVKEGDQVILEKLDGEVGDTVKFDQVLMAGEGDTVKIGAPLVDGAIVVGEIGSQQKGDKITIRKKRQRNTYRRTQGHRQLETVVTITGISTDGTLPSAKKKAAPKKAPKPKAETPKPTSQESAPKKVKPAEAKAETDAQGRLSVAIGEPDDLKKIKGVGKVLEGKLNGAGIFHFWQIAALNESQIESLEADMSFPGRIGRDNWVEQAKEFSAE